MISGKTIFAWNVPDTGNGDPKEFTKIVIDGGFEGILLKVADGNNIFNMKSTGPWPTWGENVRPELINELRSAGLKIYFWQFLYGIDPRGEVNAAIYQSSRFHPDGYIWDAEGAFDSKITAISNTHLITREFKKAFPDIPQALCWWALPKNPKNYNIEWHPIKVARAFMEIVDCIMPMMYWGGETELDALTYLSTSLKIWKTITNFPIIPIGRAYTGNSGKMNPDAIIEFAKEVMEMPEINGVSWWVLDRVFENNICWDAIKSIPKFVKKLSDKEMLMRLVNNHSELFPEIFG